MCSMLYITVQSLHIQHRLNQYMFCFIIHLTYCFFYDHKMLCTTVMCAQQFIYTLCPLDSMLAHTATLQYISDINNL